MKSFGARKFIAGQRTTQFGGNEVKNLDIGEPQFFAFVLMPINPSSEDTFKLGIKETAAKLNIKAERVDEQIYREGMLERIYSQIEHADIIIADMTGRNPNVFYEVGYAHAKEKLCILLTADAADIPFDLKHRRHIVYNNSLVELRRELEKHLAWARDELKKASPKPIEVSYWLNPGAGFKTN